MRQIQNQLGTKEQRTIDMRRSMLSCEPTRRHVIVGNMPDVIDSKVSMLSFIVLLFMTGLMFLGLWVGVHTFLAFRAGQAACSGEPGV
jgi:hypothetical protein